jgi:hypothetical protein
MMTVLVGANSNPQNGMTHAFVMEFRSAEDRDYYVNYDPIHDKFKKAAGEILEKVIVVDYVDGIFKL